jgi:hypothetical protein
MGQVVLCKRDLGCVWVYTGLLPYWSSKLIARTSRDPLETRAPAERDLVNAGPRLSKSSYQFKSICRCSCSAAPRASLRQRSWSWARVRCSGCHARSRTGRRQPISSRSARATPAAAQKATAAHAQRRADLGTLREAIKFTAVHENCAGRRRWGAAQRRGPTPAGRTSPTLIVQGRQSFCHMTNGHSAGVDRPQP